MAYRNTNITPVTTKTTLANAKKWLSIVRYGEYGTVIQFQDDCEYRVEEVISNKVILKKFLGPYFRKYLLKYIPVESSDLIELIKKALAEFCSKNSIKVPQRIKTAVELTNYLGNKGYEIGLFICKINNPLDEPKFHSLLALEHLLECTKNLSVILFSERNLTDPKYKYLVDKCSLIFDHVIQYPLYLEDDCQQFISYNESMWKMRLPKESKKEILKLCGGYLWLIHHLLRFLRDNPEKNLGDLSEDELLHRKLEVIWGKLYPEEQNILTNIESGGNNINKNSPEFNFLLNMRLVTCLKGKLELGIPLLKYLINKEKSLRKVELRDGRIYVEGVDVTYELTRSERVILIKLLNQKRKIIGREEIAKVIWKDNVEEKYTDWTLDRLIYRLRVKMNSKGIDKNLIRTVKGKGFILG